MAPFLVAQMRAHLGRLDTEPDARDLVFGTRTGSPPRRSNFRRQVWRPALARSGLLGRITKLAPDNWRATWRDADGIERRKEFTTERDAITHLAETVPGGLRFHGLRHSYATWLVSAGLPVNVIQRVMGHQSPTTTLAVYTHSPDDYGDRIRGAFDDRR